MTLPLTPDMLRAAYDYLCSTPPFNRWNLPPSDEIVFRVIKRQDLYGYYEFKGGRHVIGVSSARVGYTDTLMGTMGHEAIHLHQRLAGMETSAQHNAAFHKLAARVCKVHGFDPKLF